MNPFKSLLLNQVSLHPPTRPCQECCRSEGVTFLVQEPTQRTKPVCTLWPDRGKYFAFGKQGIHPKVGRKKPLVLKWVMHHLYLINLSHLCTYLAGLTREHWEQNCSRATWIPQKRHRHSLISADLESRSSLLSPLKTWLTLRCAAKIKTHGKEKQSRHRKP